MNNYQQYKEISRPYFNLQELLEIFIIPLSVNTVISSVLMYFIGIGTALFTNILVAFYITIYFHGLANAFSNNTTTAPSKNIPGIVVILSMLPTFLKVLGAQLAYFIGPYILIKYWETGIFYKIYFNGWLIVVFGLPILYLVIREIRYWVPIYYQAKHFMGLPLIIYNDPELLIVIEEISFLNTDKKLKSTITNSLFQNVNINKDLSDTDTIEEYNEQIFKANFRQTIAIPKKTNRLNIVYTSVMDGFRYHKEVVFPFAALKYEQEQFPLNKSKLLRGQKTDKVILSLQSGGVFHLYNKYVDLVDPIQLKKELLSEEEKKNMLSKFTVNNGCAPPLNELIYPLENPQVFDRIDKRIAIKNQLFSWKLTGTGLADHRINVRDIKNFLLQEEALAINTINTRPLPLAIELSYGYYQWLTIHFNAENLYDLLNPLQLKDAEATFTFNISVDLLAGKADFQIKYKNNELSFLSWQKEISNHAWQEAKNTKQKALKREKEQEILNNIYALLEAKKYQKALEMCNREIALHPDCTLLYFYKARLIFYIEGFGASFKWKEYFIEKTAKEPYALARIYNHYGCLLDDKQRYKEALTYFEKAYATYPEEIIYLANKAEILYKMQEMEWAELYAEECLKRGYNSEIISEILAKNGINPANTIDDLQLKLSSLAEQYRASKENSEEHHKALRDYYATFDQLVRLNGGIIALDPDAELPDHLMPQVYTDYWLKNNQSR